MRYMATATSYRLTAELKERLARLAASEGVTETALVTRLLEHGLATLDHPGIVRLVLRHFEFTEALGDRDQAYLHQFLKVHVGPIIADAVALQQHDGVGEEPPARLVDRLSAPTPAGF